MTSELTEKIVNQMKYYFSDFNLTRDKFMKEQMTKDEGWIPLEILLTFKRLAALTTDPAVVAEAIKTAGSDLLEVSEDGGKIRRLPDKPVPEQNDEYRQQIVKRTVHIKGFPLDSTLDQLKSYCSTFGELESLLMRKKRKGSFKGCILAVFKDPSVVDKILGETLKYNDKELLKEKEQTHLDRKAEFIKNKKNFKKGKGHGDDKKNGKKSEEPNVEEQENVPEVKVKVEEDAGGDNGSAMDDQNVANKRSHPEDETDDSKVDVKPELKLEDHQIKKVKLEPTDQNE